VYTYPCVPLALACAAMACHWDASGAHVRASGCPEAPMSAYQCAHVPPSHVGGRSEKQPWVGEKRKATLGWAKQGPRVRVPNPRFARAWPFRKSDSAWAAPRPLGKIQDLPRISFG